MMRQEICGAMYNAVLLVPSGTGRRNLTGRVIPSGMIESEPKSAGCCCIGNDVLLALKLTETELGLALVEQMGCHFERNRKESAVQNGLNKCVTRLSNLELRSSAVTENPALRRVCCLWVVQSGVMTSLPCSTWILTRWPDGKPACSSQMPAMRSEGKNVGVRQACPVWGGSPAHEFLDGGVSLGMSVQCIRIGVSHGQLL